MAKQKMQKKKTILAVSLVGLLVLVGGTIAYHTSNGSFVNFFHLGLWRNETVEEFTSPNNWSTCDEIEKTVVARNTGSVPAVVRVKYEDYWKMQGSTSTDHSSELPKVDASDGQAYATVNFQNENLWTDGGDGWYYYKYVVEPGREAKSFFKSVTLNCDKNFAGENSVCEVVDNKKTCTRPDNQYDKATYHVFITTQYIQEDGCSEWGHCAEKRHVVKCDGLELYDRVACLADGTDENEDFNYSNPNTVGNGVKAMTAYADDSYPVYYYRGKSDVKSHVIFAGYCWRIIRTTGTGGVKLLYNGLPQNGQCLDLSQYNSGVNDIYNYSAISVNNQTAFGFNNETRSSSSYNALHMVGYMYASMQKSSSSNSGTEHYVAKDVTWDGERYQLVAPRKTTYDSNAERYYCPDPNATSCNPVAFMEDYSDTNNNRFVLFDGKKYDDYMHENTTDSNAKAMIDQWYSDNMTSYTDKLEDTVYCNDRSLTNDYEKFWGGNSYLSGIYFDPYYRFYYTYKPTLECKDSRDAFTVSSENGNGNLTYPVAMLTLDEAMMAGKMGHLGLYSYNKRSWLMSSYRYDYHFNYGGSLDYDSFSYYDGSLRPVVSLKPGTVYKEGGLGTTAKPYVIE